jgi:hypothetical protein
LGGSSAWRSSRIEYPVKTFMLFFCFSSPFFMVGLNAALTYSRAKRIQRAALEDCPFTHPADIGQGLFGLTNHKNDSHAGT